MRLLSWFFFSSLIFMISHTVREWVRASTRKKLMNDIQSVRNKFEHFTADDLFYIFFPSLPRWSIARRMRFEANKFKSHKHVWDVWVDERDTRDETGWWCDRIYEFSHTVLFTFSSKAEHRTVWSADERAWRLCEIIRNKNKKSIEDIPSVLAVCAAFNFHLKIF